MDGDTQRDDKVTHRSEKVLVAGQTIAVSPALARVVGLHEALVLQQLFFRMCLGSSDRGRKWVCVMHSGRPYVGWNDEGRKEDLLLSKYPFRRVLTNLRNLAVIYEAQHIEQPFDQRTFLSIDFVRLQSICPNCTISSGEKSNMDLSLSHSSKGGIHAPTHIPRNRDTSREIETPSSLDNLMTVIENLVGSRAGGINLRDQKCIARIRHMMESGAVPNRHLVAILESPHIKFPSEIESALQQAVKGLADQLAESRRAESEIAEQVLTRRSNDQARRQCERAKQFLTSCSTDTLHSIAEEIREMKVPPPLAARAIAAVVARDLGHVPASALVLRALGARVTDHFGQLQEPEPSIA